MASSNRTALDYSFVALVLSVNGRVRPDDLQSIPGVQRAQLLQSYYDAYGASQPLHFEGDVLVSGAAPAGSAPPAAPPGPPPAAPPSPAETRARDLAAAAPAALPAPAGPPPGAPQAAAGAIGVPSSPAPAADASSPASAIPDFFATSQYESATPAAAPAPADVPAGAVPAAAGGIPGAAGAVAAAAGAAAGPAQFAATPAPVGAAAPDAGMSGDFFNIPLPAPSSDSTSFFDGAPASAGFEPVAPQPAPQKVSVLFWLLPILLTWVGGIVAYFVVRGRDAKQAKAMLVTGLVLTVVYILLAFALGALGVFGAAMFGRSGVTSELPSTPAAASPSVAADYPSWTSTSHTLVATPLTDSKDPAAKIRQDYFSQLTSPKGVSLLAWYARSGASTSTIRSVVWVNPDTLFKGTDGTRKQATSLVAKMKKDHPSERLLGAYPAGKPSNGSTTYDVGWAIVTPGNLSHGEHVYSYSASTGWKQFSDKSTTLSAWDSAGAVK